MAAFRAWQHNADFFGQSILFNLQCVLAMIQRFVFDCYQLLLSLILLPSSQKEVQEDRSDRRILVLDPMPHEEGQASWRVPASSLTATCFFSANVSVDGRAPDTCAATSVSGLYNSGVGTLSPRHVCANQETMLLYRLGKVLLLQSNQFLPVPWKGMQCIHQC